MSAKSGAERVKAEAESAGKVAAPAPVVEEEVLEEEPKEKVVKTKIMTPQIKPIKK
jgi:hypothetical protein